MRRELKHPMIGLLRSSSRSRIYGIVSAARAFLARVRSGFASVNHIRVEGCSQMAAVSGIACSSICQVGSRPH